MEKMFDDFDEKSYSYTLEDKKKELASIRNTIITDGKKNKRMYNENDFTPYFCNIYDYYNISDKKCTQDYSMVIDNNYENWKTDNDVSSKWWFPLWLKIVLIILVWWLLTMGWIIVFFSIKAKLNSSSENDEE